MASIYDGHDYYKRMLELQEKLRKSEEERIRLEERFKILVQESRSRHDACINRLRLRYIEFLEEQRVRDERNHKLLGSLDRVDSSLALMSAKTDRLNVLRKHYEAYLLRVYANRGPAGSTTGDSGIAIQNEDRCPRRIAPAAQVNVNPSEIKNSVSKFHESVQNKCYNTPEFSSLGQSSANHQITNALRNPTSSRMKTDPSITRPNNVQNLLTPRNPTPRVDQSLQGIHDPNIKPLDAYDYESNLTAHKQFEKSSLPQISPLSERNRSSTGQMEAIQAVPQFIMPEPNGNAPQHKSVDVSQNQIAPPASHQRFNPSPVAQSVRGGARPNNASADPRINDQPHSLDFRGPLYSTVRNNPPRNYFNCTLDETQSARGSSLTSTDVDDMLRRNERLVSPQNFSTFAKQGQAEDDGRTTMILENELDRYIGKIRSMHRELDMQSLEELDHEQNTSGDLLNVTLSDDDVELPVENRSKETTQLPKEVEKVLALATDLAASTVNPHDQSRTGKRDDGENSKVGLADAQPVEHAKDGIRGDALSQRPELDRQENIEVIVKEDKESSDDTRGSEIGVEGEIGGTSCETLPGTKPVKPFEENDLEESVQEERLVEENDKIHAGEEQELEEHSFDALEKVEPWAIDHVERQVREVHLDGTDKDNSTEKNFPVVTTSDDSNLEKGDVPEKIDNAGNELESQVQPDEKVNVAESSTEKTDPEKCTDDTSSSGQQEIQRVDQHQLSDGNIHKESEEMVENKVDEANEGERQETNNLVPNDGQNAEPNVLTENTENITNEPYTEEVNQTEAYAQDPDQERTDLNQEYAYDQSVPYEGNPDAQYQEYSAEQNQQYGEYAAGQYDQYGNPDGQYQDGTNVQYEQDPNAQYEQDPNVQYEQDPNAQYEQDPNLQYEQDPNVQYEQDPNMQYEQDPNVQYEQDPNVQYEQDPNAEYASDPNRQYAYSYDQQYDSNQQYENEPEQSYAYDANVPYDENQTVNVDDKEQTQNEEYGKTVDNSQSQEALEEKPNVGEGGEQEAPQETSQPKKKKDVIKSLLDSDTESTIERNVSNTESDFDFN